MYWIQLPEGELETFTQAYLKPQGFTHHEHNYIIAIANTVKGVKIMGWLENTNVENAKVGMPVKITAKMMSDGFPAIIFEPKVKEDNPASPDDYTTKSLDCVRVLKVSTK